MDEPRTPARKKARELAKHLRGERPDYAYLKQMFRYLREELEVEVSDPSSRFPDTSSEEEIRCSYKRVWEARRAAQPVLRCCLPQTARTLAKSWLLGTDLLAQYLLERHGVVGNDAIDPYPCQSAHVLGGVYGVRMEE